MKENDTKIKCISVQNKIYEVTSINWLHSYLEAKETDLSINDVPDSEVWDISYFGDFRVRLVNCGGKAEIIDMAEWLEQHTKKN